MPEQVLIFLDFFGTNLQHKTSEQDVELGNS